jgi:DedD protein
MASANTRGRGDWVLGGRHIVGVFVLLLVLFGLVFTLGYLLGRSQYDTQFRAASGISGIFSGKADRTSEKSPSAAGRKPADAFPGPPASDYEFYHSAEPAKPSVPIAEAGKTEPVANPIASEPPVKPSAPEEPVANSKGSARSLTSPLIPRGATVLQVAAFTHQADALALAQALDQKKFPAFVLTPGTDRFYRVQVGPYVDAQSAATARKKLENQGFKTIARR